MRCTRAFSAWRGLWVSGLLTLFAAAAAFAQTQSFVSSAAVPVQEDLVRARAEALGDAFGRALEQAIADVAPEARSRAYLILGRARDYVMSYRVLDEGELLGQFQIRLEVQFDLPRLLRDLQAAPARPVAANSRPVLTLCTAAPAPEAQAAVAAARAVFVERGLQTESLPASACGERLLPTESRGSGALLVFFPDAQPHSQEIRGTHPPRFGAEAHIEWKLYRPGATEPLRETGASTVFLDSPGTALVEVQRLAALSGLKRLLERPALGLLANEAAGVLLTLEGVVSYGNYQQLLKTLSALPGVSRVEPRRFWPPALSGSSGPAPGPNSASQDGMIEVLVHTSASAETIGAALGRTPLRGMRLQVAPMGPAALRVLCIAASALPDASEESEPQAPTDPGSVP